MANINIKTKKMKTETFKSLFGECEPTKTDAGDKHAFFKGSFFVARPTEDYRVISEGLYQKMLMEIEKSQPIITENTAQAIIDLATENAELRRGLGDSFLFIYEAKRGNKHITIQNKTLAAWPLWYELSKNFDTIKNHWVK